MGIKMINWNNITMKSVDAQADFSLCWAHIPFCWFSHEVVQIPIQSLQIKMRRLVTDRLIRIYTGSTPFAILLHSLFAIDF